MKASAGGDIFLGDEDRSRGPPTECALPKTHQEKAQTQEGWIT